MRRVLVSMVSAQPAPNLMLILDPAFAGADLYLFISTPRMNQEQQFEKLLAAAHLPSDKVEKVTVPADDVAGIHEVLSGTCPFDEHFYWLNITGGTKVMGFAIGNYFSNPACTVEMFYVALGNNAYRKIYPPNQAETKPLNYRFTLATYLTAYGIRQKELPVLYNRSYELEQLMMRDCIAGAPIALQVEKPSWWFANHLDALREKSGEDYLVIRAVEWMESWLGYIGYEPLNPQLLTKSELRYLKSAWFEHYIQELILRSLHLVKGSTAVGVKWYRDGADWKYRNNEFDVLFMHENRLHIVECKTAMRRNRRETKMIFNNTLYKIAALKRDFGLNVKVGLVTLSDQLREKKRGGRRPIPDYDVRAELFDMPVIDMDVLSKGEKVWLPHLLRGNGLMATTGD